MSEPVTAVVVLAVVGYVLVQQFSARQVTGGGRWWVAPVVLAFFAARRPDLIDADHRVQSVAMLVAEIASGAAIGVAWAWTTRVWRDASGVVWAKGTRTTALVWLGGIVLRAGLIGIGALIGVRGGSGSFMMAMAASLLVRTGVLLWRAQATAPAYRVSVSD